MFIHNTFHYAFGKVNTSILVLIPDDYGYVNEYKYMIINDLHKRKSPVIKHLKKSNILNDQDIQEISDWFDMWRKNWSLHQYPKANLDYEKKLLNEIVLSYNDNLLQLNVYHMEQKMNEMNEKFESAKKSMKRLDSINEVVDKFLVE